MVLQPVDDGLEMTQFRLLANGSAMLLSMVFFTSCFLGAYYRLMPRVSRQFSVMVRPLQADFASRVHSTIHATVVPLGLLWSIWECELWGEPLVNTCSSAEVFFSISIGYFLVDLVIIVAFRIEFWQVFAFHHVMALMPYAINNFVPHCSHCHFLLSLMLGVEVSTIFLNAKWLLEQTEGTAGNLYAALFYATYGSWFVVRVINPIYVVILLVNYIFPHYYFDPRVLVSYISAFAVAAFCWYCFLFIFTPEVCQRLKRKRSGKPANLPLDNNDGIADRRLLIDDDGASDKSSNPRSIARTR
eukprot:GGOE01003065.1.p1 GENE.GGOE01003065.1~~GGOE01003065.1.p1  ORF type:complete len:301 (+),score=128.00 GGOE01003065.1:54-956(+)